MDDKELLYKICIIINHKYDLCYYPVDTLTEYYDTFKNAWENEETYSVLSFFIEIAPKKEVELFLQRVNKKFAQQTRVKELSHNIVKEIKFDEIKNMQNNQFKKKFAVSPIKRTKLKGLKRNAEVCRLKKR